MLLRTRASGYRDGFVKSPSALLRGGFWKELNLREFIQ